MCLYTVTTVSMYTVPAVSIVVSVDFHCSFYCYYTVNAVTTVTTVSTVTIEAAVMQRHVTVDIAVNVTVVTMEAAVTAATAVKVETNVSSYIPIVVTAVTEVKMEAAVTVLTV